MYFYLQDSRNYTGNDLMFWALAGGYTSDVSKAEVFSLESAQRQNRDRPTDIPWPCGYINTHTRPAVDMQYVNRAEALAGSGIELAPLQPQDKPQRLKCQGCKVFMAETDYWTGECKRCGTDNRP